MEAESIPSLSPLLQAADQWSELLVLLPLLVALEAVLSADNAIALAAISRRLHDPERQRQALNLGLLLALLFRLVLIAGARWILVFRPLQLLASAYLLWLSISHFTASAAEGGAEAGDEAAAAPTEAPAPAGTAALASPDARSLAAVVATLALTDLAFSLDSVAAAVAVTDRLVVVMAGGVVGVIALRLTAGLFIRWLEIFPRLEAAGYLAVGLVGLRLLLRLIVPTILVPDWLLLVSVAALFAWGISLRSAPEA